MVLVIPENITDPTKRHDIVLMIGMRDCNPNGDPGRDNHPRQDRGIGLMSHGCLNAKLRRYFQYIMQGVEGYDLYIREDEGCLQDRRAQVYRDLGIVPVNGNSADDDDDDDDEDDSADESPTRTKRKSSATQGLKFQPLADVRAAQAELAKRYIDVRLFGGVFSLKKYPAGQCRGPVQVTPARSQSRIYAPEILLTRIIPETPKDRLIKQQEMGTIYPVAGYALYRAHIFFTPGYGQRTGVTAADLKLLYAALMGEMWPLDRSAARPEMWTECLWVFTHDDPRGLGNAQSIRTVGAVASKPLCDIPQSLEDYRIGFEGELAKGVTLTQLVG